MKQPVLIVMLLLCLLPCKAQLADSSADRPLIPAHHLPKWMAPVLQLSVAGASLYPLSKSWYSPYLSQHFHLVNDMHHWRMMDKGGHAWSAYTIARLSAPVWQLSGKSRRQAVLAAGITALGYQTIIEAGDGFSSKWGFSWGDMAANATGTLLYVAQELLWQQQVLQIKFAAYRPIRYTGDLHERANSLFGHTFSSRLLNDYNAQTYWASMNINAMLPAAKIPAWLNIAIGYGAGQLFGETSNRWTTKNNIVADYSYIPRYSRFLLSPDIDFSKINSRRKWVRILLYLANSIKIPAPALEYNSLGKFRLHALLLN